MFSSNFWSWPVCLIALILLLHIADKDRELGDAHAEIKALKYSERLKEKAVEEVLQLILAPRVCLVQHLLHLFS